MEVRANAIQLAGSTLDRLSDLSVFERYDRLVGAEVLAALRSELSAAREELRVVTAEADRLAREHDDLLAALDAAGVKHA
jgi:hypothetical protein